MNSQPAKRILQSGADPLSRLMNLSGAALADWRAQDLTAMWRHQLSAPLAFDLKTAPLKKADLLALEKALHEGGKLRINTFQDLFTHATPPLDLLVFAKNLFKRQSGVASERRPEQQLAYVLYLLTIVVARARCGESITKLTDTEVSRSVEWAVSQPWVDASTKSLITQALRAPGNPAAISGN